MEYWIEGNRAFAFWDEDEYFYPATIITIEGEDLFIRFDTGEEEWTDADYLEEFLVEVDDQVECKSAKDNLYYDVVILDVDESKMSPSASRSAAKSSLISRPTIISVSPMTRF